MEGGRIITPDFSRREGERDGESERERERREREANRITDRA